MEEQHGQPVQATIHIFLATSNEQHANHYVHVDEQVVQYLLTLWQLCSIY